MPHQPRTSRRAAAFPAAIAGSLAVSLIAAPAHAATPTGAAGTTGPDVRMSLVRVQAADPVPATYTIVAGDTVSAVAERFSLRTDDVLAWNGLEWSTVIHPGQTLRLTPPAAASTPALAPGPGTYVIRAGDTMSAIAAGHGVSVTALLEANGLGWSSIIYPGQTVVIPTGAIPGLTSEQAANAHLIVAIGRRLGVPDRGIEIALGAAMQESALRNLDHGDRDSLGLFQQRPSTGWGTPAEITDPDHAIRAFFGGPSGPNAGRTRGLLDVPGWEQMGFAQAAQSVQVSAYPQLYAQWEMPAQAWLAAIG